MDVKGWNLKVSTVHYLKNCSPEKFLKNNSYFEGLKIKKSVLWKMTKSSGTGYNEKSLHICWPPGLHPAWCPPLCCKIAKLILNWTECWLYNIIYSHLFEHRDDHSYEHLDGYSDKHLHEESYQNYMNIYNQ